MNTIGRKDKIDLPGFNLFNISAKVDTGAYGCALHCHHIELVEKDGKDVLSFKILDPSHSKYEDRVFYVNEFSDKKVKNSGGATEHRYTIKAEIIIFNESSVVDFSITNRKKMKYPILLGRTFLKDFFIVDVRFKDLSYKQKRARK